MYANLLCHGCVSSTLEFKALHLQLPHFSGRTTHTCQVGLRALSTHWHHTFECQHQIPGGTPIVGNFGLERGSVACVPQVYLVPALTPKRGSTSQEPQKAKPPISGDDSSSSGYKEELFPVHTSGGSFHTVMTQSG